MLNKTTLNKYINAIKSSKKKVFTCDDLSIKIAIKPEIIKSNLVSYNPLINFDYEFNLKEILVDLEKDYILVSTSTHKRQIIRKKELEKYEDFLDFIYQHYTTNGGLLDKGSVVTKKDLKIIRKLLIEEEKKFK